MKMYKGFDKDMKCRDFQYEIGKTYEEPTAELRSRGFHACERPLDVLRYYEPGKMSRYCEVDLDDVSAQKDNDSKRCGKKIAVKAEIGITGLVKAQIEYVKEHATMEHTDPKQATAGEFGAATAGEHGAATAGEFGAATAGKYGAATAGWSGAATAGEYGAATAGKYGAATAGWSGAATAGEYGAATAGKYGAATAGKYGAATAGEFGAATAGEYGAATAGEFGAATSRGCVSVGKNGCGLVRGENVKIKGGMGAILVIAVENDVDYDIKEWKAFVVDGETVKPDTWYTLKDGRPVEVDE